MPHSFRRQQKIVTAASTASADLGLGPKWTIIDSEVHMPSSDRYCSPFAVKYRDQPYTSATPGERLVWFQISSTQALDHATYTTNSDSNNV